jgi:hypothetical protein
VYEKNPVIVLENDVVSESITTKSPVSSLFTPVVSCILAGSYASSYRTFFAPNDGPRPTDDTQEAKRSHRSFYLLEKASGSSIAIIQRLIRGKTWRSGRNGPVGDKKQEFNFLF